MTTIYLDHSSGAHSYNLFELVIWYPPRDLGLQNAALSISVMTASRISSSAIRTTLWRQDTIPEFMELS